MISYRANRPDKKKIPQDQQVTPGTKLPPAKTQQSDNVEVREKKGCGGEGKTLPHLGRKPAPVPNDTTTDTNIPKHSNKAAPASAYQGRLQIDTEPKRNIKQAVKENLFPNSLPNPPSRPLYLRKLPKSDKNLLD